MPRPSLKSERKDQILDAYEACVARYGIEGASLEKIAEEAGLARPLIRHNIGNREALLEALVERFLARSASKMNAMITALPETEPVLVLIDWLFDPQQSDTQTVLVAEALIAASQHDKTIAKQMRAWTKSFIKSIHDVLLQSFPDAHEESITVVAVGVTGIYFNADSLLPLGRVNDIYLASKQSALLLISTLESKQ